MCIHVSCMCVHPGLHGPGGHPGLGAVVPRPRPRNDIMVCYTILYIIILHHVILCYVILYHIISYHIIAFRVTLSITIVLK